MGCDHVVYTAEGWIICQRCGVEALVPFPLAVEDFVKMTTDFISNHSTCKENHQ
jgi:hypothetical protein